MKKKVLKIMALVGCALLLVVGSVAGTLAYLTAETDTVKNTFTAGKVSITLDEAKVDLYGVKADPETRVLENEYKLIPGHEYVKDPTIHVEAGSEDCYIFFELANGLGEYATLNISENWVNISGTNVYYYDSVAEAGNSYVAFSKFVLAGNADVKDLVAADATITVKGYAVQAEGFDTAAEAWDAAPASWKTANNG